MGRLTKWCITALGALDNLKAKLKAVFKDKKHQDKPAAATETKPADNPTPATAAEGADVTKTAPADPAPAGMFIPRALSTAQVPRFCELIMSRRTICDAIASSVFFSASAP